MKFKKTLSRDDIRYIRDVYDIVWDKQRKCFVQDGYKIELEDIYLMLEADEDGNSYNEKFYKNNREEEY